MSSSHGHFFQGTGTEPSRRTVSEPGRQEHWMHTTLAGPCSPGQMQSFKLEIHRVFETQRWEAERKATGLSSRARPAHSTQIHSRTLGRGGEQIKSGPPTFTGADSSVCAVCTHLPPLVPQLKSISFMVREGSLPLWPSPAPLFSWVCAGTTGEIWGLCSPFICVCHFPQVLHQGLVGGYKFTCWVPACHTQSPAFLLPVASAWAGVPAGPKDRSQAGLCKYLAILGREVDWKKGGWKWEESKSLIWLSKRSEVILL